MAFRTNKTPVLQEKTASGSVASFNTILQKPLVNGEFTIQAYQEGSGDPSPVNMRNIVPRREVNIYQRGINQWDEETESGMIDTTTGQNVANGVRTRTKNYNKCLPNTTYYACSKNNKQLTLFFYGADKSFIRYSNATNNTFITPSNAYYFRFFYFGTTYDNDISINYPSTDTDYHAYNGEDYTVDLGEDVYGGSYNSVSESRNKRKTHEIIAFDGSSDENWINYSAGNGYYIQIVDMEHVNNGEVMSNYLPQYSDINNLGIRLGFNNNYAYMYQVNTLEGVTDVESWRAYLQNNPLTFVYPLAEPIESNIGATPIKTFNGSNNIFCDTGDTSLVFKDLDIAKRGNFREVFKLPS